MNTRTRTNLPIGTFIDMAAIVLGSLIGLMLQQAFPENLNAIIFQGIGLTVILIGIRMGMKFPGEYLLVLVFSMILGGVIGELIGVDAFFNSFGDSIKSTFNIESASFTEGMITTFIVCCIGPMTIIGSIEEGISGNRDLLGVKALLDFVTAIALATTFGIGVMFSIILMLIFQGGITLTAARAKDLFTEEMIIILSTAGGLLLIGLAFNVMEMGQINVSNLLPSLVVVVVFSWAYQKYYLKGKKTKED